MAFTIEAGNVDDLLRKLRDKQLAIRAAAGAVVKNTTQAVAESERSMAPPPTTVDRVRDHVMTIGGAAEYMGQSREYISHRMTSGKIRAIGDVATHITYARVHPAWKLGSKKTDYTHELLLGIHADDSRAFIDLHGEVTNACPHATYVETGTGQRGAADGNPVKMPFNAYRMDWAGMVAQPFVYPAYLIHKKKFPADMRAALEKLL